MTSDKYGVDAPWIRNGTGACKAVRIAKAEDMALLAACDFSFLITQIAVGPFDGPRLGRVAQVEPAYRKNYGFDGQEVGSYIDGEDSTLFVVETQVGLPVGYAAVSHGWNDFAFVDDIAVDANHRGSGLARQLMDAAVAWGLRQGLPGIRLETQSNNVGACRFYESYGFELGGYDRHFYEALHPGTEEIALFWYFRFETKPGRY
jgi:streptothricin acetyltransferase